MSQTELSNSAGVGENGKPILPPATLSNIIDGTTNECNIGVGKILKIAEALGVSVEYLYGKTAPDLPAYPDDVKYIANIYENMNDDGRQDLVEYAHFLSNKDKYKKDNKDRLVQKQA